MKEGDVYKNTTICHTQTLNNCKLLVILIFRVF